MIAGRPAAGEGAMQPFRTAAIVGQRLFPRVKRVSLGWRKGCAVKDERVEGEAVEGDASGAFEGGHRFLPGESRVCGERDGQVGFWS